MTAPASWERELSPEEFEAKVARVLADDEDRAGVRELIRWFTTRYPTPEARLAYARKKALAARRRGGVTGA